jgi:hypothetical protein
VNEGNSRFFLSVAHELGNYELYFGIHEVLQHNVTTSAFCERVKSCVTSELLSDREIEFLAAHFIKLERAFLRDLPISILSRVLAHPSLVVETEDWLYEFVVSTGHLVDLLEYLRFEFLTRSTIRKFVAWSFEHFESIEFTFSLWQVVATRLSQSMTPTNRMSNRYPNLILPQDGSPLNGIISRLTQLHGGNVHDRKIVTVSASSVLQINFAHNAVNLKNHSENYFQSQGQPNQWLCYDFKDRRVRLRNYSIATLARYFLRSWVVEGSEDGKTWNVVDDRRGNTEADCSHPIVTFAVDAEKKFRFIRLRQTGKNMQNDDYLVLYGFEVFGFLFE